MVAWPPPGAPAGISHVDHDASDRFAVGAGYRAGDVELGWRLVNGEARKMPTDPWLDVHLPGGVDCPIVQFAASVPSKVASRSAA